MHKVHLKRVSLPFNSFYGNQKSWHSKEDKNGTSKGINNFHCGIFLMTLLLHDVGKPEHFTYVCSACWVSIFITIMENDFLSLTMILNGINNMNGSNCTFHGLKTLLETNHRERGNCKQKKCYVRKRSFPFLRSII